jgi:hypothetical protein
MGIILGCGYGIPVENLFETGSLRDSQLYESLHDRAVILGKKLNNFIHKIEQDLAATK